MQTIIKYTIKLTIAATMILAVPGCSNPKEEPIASKFKVTDSLISRLLVDTVQQAGKTTDITFSAKIAANEEQKAEIFPMVSGTVQRVPVQSGDQVSKGQVLAVLNSAEISGFDKDVTSALAELSNAERELEQVKELFNSGLSSARELKIAQNELLIKRAEHRRAEATLKLNGGNTDGMYRIVSPLNGVVIEKKIISGMHLRPDNNNSLFTIADLSDVWAIINIYESEISGIKAGDEVELSVLSYPEKSFKGKIEKIYSQLDDESKVMNARVKLANPGNLLKPGMMATAKVAARSDIDLPVVNSRGLIFDNNQYFVLILDENEEVTIRQVKVWRRSADKVHISEGLTAGDRIIASKQVFIYESLK